MYEVNVNVIHKKFLVWLLAVLVMVPFASQSVHIYLNEFHNECEHSDSCNGSGHDCNTCPVCHFTYSAFTEVDIQTFDILLQSIFIPELIRTQEVGFAPVLPSFYLRGPPQA